MPISAMVTLEPEFQAWLYLQYGSLEKPACLGVGQKVASDLDLGLGLCPMGTELHLELNSPLPQGREGRIISPTHLGSKFVYLWLYF